ncbi:MAG TPA: hypothetical protein VNS63_12015 [Blastocatellia bacterium]|nr:hypothetical protein [Blastocatellia bacterium]
MTRRIEITVETDEITIIRGSRESVFTLCPVCPEPVFMMTPEQAAVMSGTNTPEIYHLVDEGRLHHEETREGFFLVCPNSIVGLVTSHPERQLNRTKRKGGA